MSNTRIQKTLIWNIPNQLVTYLGFQFCFKALEQEYEIKESWVSAPLFTVSIDDCLDFMCKRLSEKAKYDHKENEFEFSFSKIGMAKIPLGESVVLKKILNWESGARNCVRYMGYKFHFAQLSDNFFQLNEQRQELSISEGTRTKCVKDLIRCLDNIMNKEHPNVKFQFEFAGNLKK